MDRLDEHIVEQLTNNARQSGDILAKRLGVSSATIRRRIKRLVVSQAIRILPILKKPSEFGYPVSVMIAFDVEHNKIEKTAQLLGSIPQITWVVILTGRYDIMVTALFRSTEELAKFMMKKVADMEGVKDTETYICLDVTKGGYGTIDSF